jgi:hypothetical protein
MTQLNNVTLYFPRWLFPNNLGDSLNVTFVPRVLKQLNPKLYLEVVTQGFCLDLMQRDTNVDSVREAFPHELRLDFPSVAFSDIKPEGVLVIYPDWHPKVFSFWQANQQMLEDHPTANLITVNYLLQLQLEYLLFDDTYDFSESINLSTAIRVPDGMIHVGVNPATKLSGKSSPHPSCNGVGLRFNGENGIASWKLFAETLRKSNPKIHITEFSDENFGIGDTHFYDRNVFKLAEEVDKMDIGVMSDGGIHHIFNARGKPVVLFQATKINKVEFFKLKNTFFPEHLHLPCRKHCPSYFLEVMGGEDASKTCQMECERMSPIALAEYVNKVIKTL